MHAPGIVGVSVHVQLSFERPEHLEHAAVEREQPMAVVEEVYLDEICHRTDGTHFHDALKGRPGTECAAQAR
jgi:hypothetical protein